MRKIRKSKFAIFVKKENGNYIVYSSMSGAVIVFNQEAYIKMLEDVLEKDAFKYQNNDFFNLMLDKKIFIDDFVDEDLLVRGMCEEQIVRLHSLELMLIVTRQCNFRCVYCGQPHLDEKMDGETYDSILTFIKGQIVNNRYTNVHVTFFGGEPLIEFNNICSFLQKLKKIISDMNECETKITFEVGMSTNGYLLTPKRFEKLIELNCNFYQISIDGMPNTHNGLRPLVSGKPTWQKIIDNIRYMISTDRHFTILLRTNFNADVAESLVDFYRYIGDEINDRRINIYYETIKNQGNEKTPDTICGIEELVLDVDIAQIIRENSLVCVNATNKLLPCSRVCYASKPNFFVIDERAQILKCSFALDDPRNVIGALDKDGNYNPNKYNYCNWVYRDYLTSEKCKSCKALPLCFGKRCPKTLIQLGEMQCNTDIIQAEIEGLLDSYFI